MSNKKSYRKYAVTTMAAAAAVASVAPVAISAETKDFTDVNTNHDFYNEIKDLSSEGLITGYEDGTFRPHAPIRRVSVANMIQRDLKLDVPSDLDAELNKYVDAKVGDEYDTVIGAVSQAGILTGNQKDQFNPWKDITREQMASVLYRAYDLGQYDADHVDVNLKGVDDSHKDAVQTLADLGITQGTALENFNPLKPITRGQFAAQMHRTLEVVNAPVEEGTPAVESVSATNGELVVTLTGELGDTPISSDFKVVQEVNGTTKSVAPSSVKYDADTKTATLTVPEISATEADQTVSYTVAFKETDAVSSNSFTIDKVGELAATGVAALSSTQIKVQFNQKVDKTTAEALANYELGKEGSPFGGKTSGDDPSIKLQEDGQSVIITLANDTDYDVLNDPGFFDNNTTFILKVSEDILPVYGKAAEKSAELPFTVKDTAKPTVDGFTVNEAGDLVVKFSEKLNAGQDVKVIINGQALEGTPVYAAGKSTVTFTKTQLTNAKPNGFGLTLGETYNVSVAEAEDVYENKMNIYTSKFTYQTVAEAPQVESVTADSESSFIVKFSEPVSPVDAANTLTGTDDVEGFHITKGAKQYGKPTATLLDDGVSYLVEFNTNDLNDDNIYSTFNNETSVNLDIYVTDIKDSSGNITPASTHTVTLAKDTVKPEVVKKSNKDDGKLDLTFNKAFDTSKVTAANLAGKVYVLTSTGIKESVDSTDITVTNPNNKGHLAFDFGGATNLDSGNYTLVLESGAVVDTALNGGNKNNEIRVPFIVADEGLVEKPVVDGPIVANDPDSPGDIKITFEKKISYESAAKASNYTLDGESIPANSEFALASDGKTLTITLPEATFKESGDKVIKVNGVRNLAGAVMDGHEEVITVNENEKIELKTATVVNGDIIFTFNENVDDDSLNTKFTAADDFIVNVNGVDIPATTGFTIANHNDDADPKVDKNQIRVKANSPDFSFETGTITIKVKEDAKAKDAAGNGAKPVTITVTR